MAPIAALQMLLPRVESATEQRTRSAYEESSGWLAAEQDSVAGPPIAASDPHGLADSVWINPVRISAPPATKAGNLDETVSSAIVDLEIDTAAASDAASLHASPSVDLQLSQSFSAANAKVTKVSKLVIGSPLGVAAASVTLPHHSHNFDLAQEDLADELNEYELGYLDDETQRVELVMQDHTGRRSSVSIARTAPVRMIMESYCQNMGYPANMVHFTMYDEPLFAHDTANVLGLENGDVVDVGLTYPGKRKSETLSAS